MFVFSIWAKKNTTTTKKTTNSFGMFSLPRSNTKESYKEMHYPSNWRSSTAPAQWGLGYFPLNLYKQLWFWEPVLVAMANHTKLAIASWFISFQIALFLHGSYRLHVYTFLMTKNMGRTCDHGTHLHQESTGAGIPINVQKLPPLHKINQMVIQT